MSLLKVLQELLRPWYKSASNHKPNRPLKRKYMTNFRLYIIVKILEAVETTRVVIWRNLGNSEDLLDRMWRAQSWQSTCQEARGAVPSLSFVPVSGAERRTERAAVPPPCHLAVCTASCGCDWHQGTDVRVPFPGCLDVNTAPSGLGGGGVLLPITLSMQTMPRCPVVQPAVSFS